MDCTCHYDSPLGGIALTSDGERLVGLWFDDTCKKGTMIDGNKRLPRIRPKLSFVFRCATSSANNTRFALPGFASGCVAIGKLILGTNTRPAAFLIPAKKDDELFSFRFSDEKREPQRCKRT